MLDSYRTSRTDRGLDRKMENGEWVRRKMENENGNWEKQGELGRRIGDYSNHWIDSAARWPNLASGGTAQMLRWISSCIDDISIKMSLNDLQEKLYSEFLRSGMAEKEAQDRAWHEIFISMRADGLDLTSYSRFREWKSGYMKDRIRPFSNDRHQARAQ
jgi:hypothetical protein